MLLTDAAGPAPESIRESLRAHVLDPTSNSRLIAAFDRQRGGPCLPFELNDDQRLVAHALISRRRPSSPDCFVFSALSRINAGALGVERTTIRRYFDSAAPPVEYQDAWFYPGNADRYREAINGVTAAPLSAQLSVEKSLTIVFPLGSKTAIELSKTDFQFTTSLVNDGESSERKSLRINAKYAVDNKKNTLTITLRDPNDILRFTATAEVGGWVVVSLNQYKFVARLRPIDSAQLKLSCLCAGSETENLLMHIPEDLKIAVPTSLLPSVWPYVCRHSRAITPEVLDTAVCQGLVKQ